MEIQQVSVIGAFQGKELEAIVYKNGDTSIYKVEKMGVDEIAVFLKWLSLGSDFTRPSKGTNE